MENSKDQILFIKRLINRISRPFGINPFPRSFENPIALKIKSANEVFNEIYRTNYWKSSETYSGVGSELNFVYPYIKRLRKVINKYNLEIFFDAPCGDLNWMNILINDGTIKQYHGGDISEEIIKKNRENYPHLSLNVFDITKDSFPTADVWHCRDCLFHLPFSAIYNALENFLDSDIPFALITSHRSYLMHKNLDVGYGGFRFLDLEKEPFSLPNPIERIPDFRIAYDFPRYVCLWSKEQIAELKR